MRLNTNLSDIKLPKIKISPRIIAVLVAVVSLYALYWVKTVKVQEIETKTDRLNSEITVLTQTKNELLTLYNNIEYYLNETTRLTSETDNLLDKFPTFMYLEDKILYADTLLKEDLSGYNLSSFSYGQSTHVMDVTGSNGKEMKLYSVVFRGRYSDLTYTQVKSLLNYGLTSPQRFVMNNITMNHNEKTGLLSGEFSFTTYFIDGQKKQYEFPDDVIIDFGDDNREGDLFGGLN